MFHRLVSAHRAAVKSLFDQLLFERKAGAGLVAAFEQKATTLSCIDNQILFQKGDAGDCVYLVRAGEVDLILSLSSTHAMGFRANSGCVIGLPAAFSKDPYSMTAIAYRGAELGVMGREEFCHMVASDPQLTVDVLRILASETHAARIAIVDAGMKRRRRTAAAHQIEKG